MSPGKRRGRGLIHVSSPPSLQMEGGAVTRRESIAVQPQNKGAVHWLSYLLRTASCVGNLPPP